MAAYRPTWRYNDCRAARNPCACPSLYRPAERTANSGLGADDELYRLPARHGVGVDGNRRRSSVYADLAVWLRSIAQKRRGNRDSVTLRHGGQRHDRAGPKRQCEPETGDDDPDRLFDRHAVW